MKKHFIISTFLMLSYSLFATETISYRNILKQTSTKEAFVEKMKVVEQEIAVSGNVLGVHCMQVDMIWEDPKITNSDVFFISFETNKNKEKEDIDIILKKLKIAK